jgi:WD domain, G-beta repeat
MQKSKHHAIDLNLDGELESMKEEHPRRLVPMPSSTTNNGTSGTDSMLVYGGSSGLIRALHTQDRLSNSNIDGDNVHDFLSLDKDCLPRRWDEDEDIRAVAISSDKSRIALGVDSGCTFFLLYNKADSSKQTHPFTDPEKIPQIESGPSFAAPVRDIQFHPQSSDWVVIATEEGVCMLHIPCTTASDTSKATYTKYFEEEAAKAHDGSGVRCVCFSPSGDIVASLGMDGRLCLWYVSLKTTDVESKPYRQWTLIHRDSSRCITKRDAGEILGADAWDRSCRPYFITDTLLVLPGETYLQFQHIHSTFNNTKNSWTVTSQVEGTQGHVESIVTYTSFCDGIIPNHKYLIATGRDKRITLWSMNLKLKSKVTSGDMVPAIIASHLFR